MKYLLFLFLLILPIVHIHGQIHGMVTDENALPLPQATLLLLPDSILGVTGIDGQFQLENIPEGEYTLEVSYIGYNTKSIDIIHDLDRHQHWIVQLEPTPNLLEQVVVTDEHAKQEETLHSEHIHEDFFRTNLQGAFSKTIEKLPGISAINVGVGIAKPVIRGLSANRIIVNHMGIKQESQQWGSDHGLEIDQFDVERVEIVKGPGSLQYGSDGLGGVINIMPGHIPPVNSISGSIQGVHKTNNDHWGGSALLSINIDDWFVGARYSLQSFADYQVPANEFNYNGFVLPIVNQSLKNTAGEESNLSITGGVKRRWGITRFHYSHYSLDAGLFSGAVGIPRSYVLTDDGNNRDIDVPLQNVDHYRLSLNHTFLLGDDHLTFDVGYQRNLRKEKSEPEFHSIPLSQLADPNDKLAIQLELQTFSFSTHYEHRFRSNWKNIYGANVQWQNNRRNGFEYLLPDFQTFRGGVFTISEREVNDHWLINGGVRLDVGSNQTDFFRQYIWDSNENITDSLISPATDDLFYNWSASLGTSLTLNEGHWVLKANFGRSFRVPYPAETVSNGIHHGTFRHEMGTPDLDSEHGYQLDVSAEWNFENFKGSVATYFNYFQDYIYLGPTFPARFSKLPEAGQIFKYRQDNAIYTGFEMQWHWEFLRHLKLSQYIDFVQSYNPETRLALPFTPQPAVRTDLRFFVEKWINLNDSYLQIEHQYHFAAEGRSRIDRSELSTPSYQIWGLGIGTNLQIANQEFQISCQVQNFFNTSYFAHLSRYRLINVPEQGRNIVLSVKVPFAVKLAK